MWSAQIIGKVWKTRRKKKRNWIHVLQVHVVPREGTNLGKAISSACIALSGGRVPVKPAPEMTSFVHCNTLGHSDWHANTEQLPQTNPVAYLSQKTDSSQSYEWLFTHLQKEMQSARQPTATVVHDEQSYDGETTGNCVDRKWAKIRDRFCYTRWSHEDTDKAPSRVQLQMATKLGGFSPVVLSRKRRMALPHQRWSLACWRCERKGTGVVDLCSPSVQCQLPSKAWGWKLWPLRSCSWLCGSGIWQARYAQFTPVLGFLLVTFGTKKGRCYGTEEYRDVFDPLPRLSELANWWIPRIVQSLLLIIVTGGKSKHNNSYEPLR